MLYTACLCKLPEITPDNLHYKLYVKEYKNQKKIVFEEYLSELPTTSFALNR